jgi:hypothetical protein
MYSESGLVPSPSMFQNHVLIGVMSFEVLRQWRNWMSIWESEKWSYIWELDADLTLTGTLTLTLTLTLDLRNGPWLETGRRSESIIYIMVLYLLKWLTFLVVFKIIIWQCLLLLFLYIRILCISVIIFICFLVLIQF